MTSDAWLFHVQAAALLASFGSCACAERLGVGVLNTLA